MNGSESHDKQDGVPVRHCSDAALSLCADQVNVGLLVFVFFCSMIVYGLRITARSGIELIKQRHRTRAGLRNMMSRTKIFTFIVAALLFGAVIWWGVPKSSQEENPRSEESLNRLAVQINRAVPVMIDKETELLTAAGTEGVLTYNYRLVSYSVSQLDAVKFATGAKERVTQGACNRPETREDLLKQGVTLRYAYFDKDKQHIATIDVLPADCDS
jgi:hypothetical protein